jgi:uncharacterized protein YhfF
MNIRKIIIVSFLTLNSFVAFSQDYNQQVQQKQKDINNIEDIITQKDNALISANSNFEGAKSKYKIAQEKVSKAKEAYERGSQNSDIVTPEQLSKLLTELQSAKKDLATAEQYYKELEILKNSGASEIATLRNQKTQKEIEIYEVLARQFDEGIKQTVWVEGTGESIMDENKTLKQAQDLSLEYAKIDAMKKGGRALVDYIQKSNPQQNPNNPISTQTVTSDKIQIVEQDNTGNYGKAIRVVQGDVIKFTAQVRIKVQSVATYNPYRIKISELKGLKVNSNSNAESFNSPTNEGLIAFYPFNGTTNDESGSNKNTQNRGATFCNDRHGNSNQAISLNGNSYVQINSNFSNLTEATISCWIKVINNSNDFQAIVSSTEGGEFIHLQMLESGGNSGPYVDGTLVLLTNPSPFPLNQWKHIVIVVKSGNSKIYENGRVVSNSSRRFSNINSTNTVLIGAGYKFGRKLYGDIDDVRIYNRAITDNEVQSLYNE